MREGIVEGKIKIFIFIILNLMNKIIATIVKKITICSNMLWMLMHKKMNDNSDTRWEGEIRIILLS